ncbi:MAG TPA: hypothetical protein VHF27_01510 [Acidimicrobiales bacterium]|nr:hypothetical protein [Acidimicrobiales bacterium]
MGRLTDSSPKRFTSAAGAGERGVVGVALVRPTPEAPVVELVAVPGLAVGQLLTGPRADAVRRASRSRPSSARR